VAKAKRMINITGDDVQPCKDAMAKFQEDGNELALKCVLLAFATGYARGTAEMGGAMRPQLQALMDAIDNVTGGRNITITIDHS
jgi:hypothetical protein